MHPSCTQMPWLLNKWSWGLCVIPIWWITYNVNKLTHITYLVMYLVTIIEKKKSNLSIFAYLIIYALKFHPNALTFELNRHEVSLWYPIWWITYSVNKLNHITHLVMYLVTIIKKKKSNMSIFACLLIYAPKLHPVALTFEINGHEASVWYQYDELHIMWTNWPI